MENKKLNYEKAALKQALANILKYSELQEVNGNEDYRAGKQIAYMEVLGAIQYALESFDLPLEEYDMNFDIDNMYE